ncbi:MAG: SusD/RagB family nutrient-binding outer membrane lipoprotein [Puia sp.]|nr:SusD/RagB family nutrient-binding outer membrane lipoprotein [Puia sp.]
MKSKNIIIVILLAGLFAPACKKNFIAINTDPEHLDSATINYKYLFTAAELITSGNSDANAYEDWRNNLIYGSTMLQHLSSTQSYWNGDKYTYNAGYNSAYWEQNYTSPVQNITEVIYHTKTDTGLTNFYNIARIFRVFMFQRITDMYGDCPYSEAGLGFITKNVTPVYDKQQDIYTNMFSELQDAASKLNAGEPNTVGAADVVFGGDVGEWKKFAYSEMLRLAMRLVNVDPATAQSMASAAVSGGVMTSISDNAVYTHQDFTQGQVTVDGTGLVLDGVDADASRVSEFFINMLKSTSDPRLTYIATVASDPTDLSNLGDTTSAIQLGQPNGYDNNGGATDIRNAPNWPKIPNDPNSDSLTVYQNRYSIVNRNTYARLDAPTFFLTYAETALLEAEAAYRGWISGDPATFYTAGVTAAMDQFGQMSSLESATSATPATYPPIPAGAIAAYLAANPYSSGTALEQINTQYWITTFLDEYEAFANWRRSGFPTLTPVNNYIGNVTNGTIPRRFTYSVSEQTANAVNYQAAASRMTGGDKMTSRVWWDVAP